MSSQPHLVVIDHDDGSASAILRSLDANRYRLGRSSGIDEILRGQRDDPADLLLVHIDSLPEILGGSAPLLDDGGSHEPVGVLVYASEAVQLKGRMVAGLRDFLLPPFEPELVQMRVEAALDRGRSVVRRADETKREELLKLERDL